MPAPRLPRVLRSPRLLWPLGVAAFVALAPLPFRAFADDDTPLISRQLIRRLRELGASPLEIDAAKHLEARERAVRRMIVQQRTELELAQARGDRAAAASAEALLDVLRMKLLEVEREEQLIPIGPVPRPASPFQVPSFQEVEPLLVRFPRHHPAPPRPRDND